MTTQKTYRTAGDVNAIPACKQSGYPIEWWEQQYRQFVRDSQQCLNPNGKAVLSAKARDCLRIVRHLQTANQRRNA